MPELRQILNDQRDKRSAERRSSRESMEGLSVAEIAFQTNLLRRRKLGAVAEATVRKAFERGKVGLVLLDQIVKVLRDSGGHEAAGIYISFNGQDFKK
ncbi:MAG: hypothetical protein HC825_01660 [Oscillatoriales cyanobacterium RM1_1_9]|nr:hypothetical protein [Oscillatoriales cyanobacterium RM2_1_1]NJO70760.1 hypothetical protein [Oscillatoriales cyanobacterium RM1_1_9]